MNANQESLEKIHGKGNVTAAWNEIRELGQFGDVSINHAGGLDLAGVLADSNTNISSADKDRIAELAGGIDRNKATQLADAHVGTTGTKKTQKEK
jgi:hypothetical protein